MLFRMEILELTDYMLKMLFRMEIPRINWNVIHELTKIIPIP